MYLSYVYMLRLKFEFVVSNLRSVIRYDFPSCRPSCRPSVHPSAHPSVLPSTRLSVTLSCKAGSDNDLLPCIRACYHCLYHLRRSTSQSLSSSPRLWMQIAGLKARLNEFLYASTPPRSWSNGGEKSLYAAALPPLPPHSLDGQSVDRFHPNDEIPFDHN